MAVILIPFDYDERTHPGVVPIMINDIDKRGVTVFRGWIESVVPIADRLIGISTRMLKSPWYVSEITEHAVHAASRANGENVGDRPDLKILSNATWRAKDLQVGGRRKRQHADVELFNRTVDCILDEYDHARQVEAADALEKIKAELIRAGMYQEAEMVPMMLRDASAEEFTARFGKSRNTISQQFYRGMRKAAKRLGLVWP